jgi:hypothetical protein
MAPETKPLRQSRLVWTVTTILFITAVLVVMLSSPEKPESFVWMTPEQLALILKPSKLTQLKYTVLRWPGPWRWFQGRKTLILIESRWVALPAGTDLPIEHPLLCNTNRDGARIWIVPAEELASFKTQVKMVTGLEEKAQMRLTTAHGLQSGMLSGSSAPAPLSAFCGFAADILPKIADGSFKLLLGITASEPDTSAQAIVRTNLSFACRAIVPNGGALIVDAAKNNSGTNYWVIVSPTAVDAKGNPIKLTK